MHINKIMMACVAVLLFTLAKPAHADLFSERSKVVRKFGPGKRLQVGLDCRADKGIDKILFPVVTEAPGGECELPLGRDLVIFADTSGHTGRQVKHEDKKSMVLRVTWLDDLRTGWKTLYRQDADTEKEYRKKLEKERPRLSKADIEERLYPGVLRAVIPASELRAGVMKVIFDHAWDDDVASFTINFINVTLEEYLRRQAVAAGQGGETDIRSGEADAGKGRVNDLNLEFELQIQRAEDALRKAEDALRKVNADGAEQRAREAQANRERQEQEERSRDSTAMVEYWILVPAQALDEGLVYCWWVNGQQLAIRQSDWTETVQGGDGKQASRFVVGRFYPTDKVSIGLPKGSRWGYYVLPGSPRTFHICLKGQGGK